MSTWNYRIVKKKVTDRKNQSTSVYSLHEVYYNNKGNAWGMTKEPIDFGTYYCETDKEAKAEIVSCLEMAMQDAMDHPVFEEPENWAPDDIELKGTLKIKDKDGNEEEFWCPKSKCKGQVEVWHKYDFDTEEEKETIEEFFKDKDETYRCIECFKEAILPEGFTESEINNDKE